MTSHPHDVQSSIATFFSDADPLTSDYCGSYSHPLIPDGAPVRALTVVRCASQVLLLLAVWWHPQVSTAVCLASTLAGWSGFIISFAGTAPSGVAFKSSYRLFGLSEPLIPVALRWCVSGARHRSSSNSGDS